MPKRKTSVDEYDDLLKKRKEIEEQLEIMAKSRENRDERELPGSGDDSSSYSSSQVEQPSDVSEDEDEELLGFKDNEPVQANVNDTQDTDKEHNEEVESYKPLHPSLRAALGEDPNESKALKVRIHPDLMKRWQYYSTRGLKKEEREKLENKYKVPDALAAPVLNNEITSRIQKTTVTKDGYRYERQKLTSQALTALGDVTTFLDGLADGSEEFDYVSNRLADIGSYLAQVQFLETTSRKANITPRLPKEVQEVLNNTVPDTMLFGKDLPTRIKELKDADKLFKEFAPKKSQSKNAPAQGTKRFFGNKASANKPSGNQGSQGKPFFRRTKFQRHKKNQEPKGSQQKAAKHKED